MASSAAWQGEMSDSLGYELLEDPGTARLCGLENSVKELQHLLVSLRTTVGTLSSQVEEGNLKNGLLMKTVEIIQDKNLLLERTMEAVLGRNSGLEKSVEAMAGKHSLLERAVHCVLDTVQAGLDELSDLKESLLELLASCEGFQKGADEMLDKQKSIENQMKDVKESLKQSKAETDVLKEQLAKLGELQPKVPAHMAAWGLAGIVLILVWAGAWLAGAWLAGAWVLAGILLLLAAGYQGLLRDLGAR